MGLPFQQESVESMQARFSQALDREFDADKIADGEPDRPGLHRENVFDFEDGIRIIISKDRTRGNLFLHLSGSSQLGRVSFKTMLEEMVKRLLVLNQRPFSGVAEASASTEGVIHLVIPLGAKQEDPADSWKSGG